MDHALPSFDQLKALFHSLVSPDPRAMIDFTADQRQALPEAETPVPARDPETKKEYIILQREVFEQLKRVFEMDEVDSSLFEFEELDTVIDTPRTL